MEKKLKIYNEYRKNIGYSIDNLKNTTIFEKSDYDEIIKKLIKKYSSQELFKNKNEVKKLIRQKPKSTGWFSVGQNIWNNLEPLNNKKYLDNLIEELHFGFGDEEECIVFLNREMKVYSLNYIDEYKNKCILEDGIHCGTDNPWIYSYTKNNSIKLNQFGKGEYNGYTETLYKSLTPKNKILVELVSDFLKLRLKQIEDKNKEYVTLVSDKNRKIKDSKKSIKGKFDNDGNGVVDIIEGDDVFMKLFKQNQKKIIENDKSNIQKFVKVSNYLKTKRQNIQNIYIELMDYELQEDPLIQLSPIQRIKKLQKEKGLGLLDSKIIVDNNEDLMKILTLDDLENILKNQIHSFESILFHSLNMINSLVEEDLITFYEIYESFDKLNMFNSNWENEVSDKLTNIGEGLEDLMFSIQKMEVNIVSQLETLTYVTNDGLLGLNKSLTTKLTDINSSLNLNNLLTGIQTYQMYKINNNTKSIN